MTLHRLSSVSVGVPNVTETIAYYREFGLTSVGEGWLSTRDGGRQLHIVHSPTRRLVEMIIGVDSADDLDGAAAALARAGFAHHREGHRLSAVEKTTGVRATLQVEPHLTQRPVVATPYNGPGRYERQAQRAPGVLRTERVMPRKLGHAVIGTSDFGQARLFFTDCLGFKVSDHIKDAGIFLRCSNDHHNLLVLAAPLSFLHHTSWQVDDIDDVGRGAYTMLEHHPERHVWGLGRHYAGSNFFWYLKDPAGNFSEYYSDMDCIAEDQLWAPEVLEGAKGLFSWGPPPPPSFLHPDDLADLMTSSHATSS